MKTNIETIHEIIDYIEEHMDEELSIVQVAKSVNYSAYHLSRMFSEIVGFSLHQYICRRRLTEAAKQLVFSQAAIMDIALAAGYDSQQAFTKGFKEYFKMSPNAFRKKHSYLPLQLKFVVDGSHHLRGDRMMDVREEVSKGIILVGYGGSTKHGFGIIGKCWRKLHKKKGQITRRDEMDFLVGVNDYSTWAIEGEQKAFDYFAGASIQALKEVDTDMVCNVMPDGITVPKGMSGKILPASKYIVFRFRGKCQDSLEPVADYIYKEWFPKSTSKLNENARYDFAKYGEIVDNDGTSLIEYWVSIL